MGVIYRITPELNLLYFKATGSCKISTIFEVERLAFHDSLRKPDMKIIFDALEAEIDFGPHNIKDYLALNRDLDRKGWTLEQTAVLTKSRFAETISDMFHLLADGLPIKLKIVHTLKDALDWLQLSEHEEQILGLSGELAKE